MNSDREAIRTLVNEVSRNWQPIETAPVNQSVLVFIPNEEHYGHGVYRALRPHFGTLRPWQVTGLHMGKDCDQRSQPTHWMPLPDAPSDRERNEEQIAALDSPKSEDS